jgi:hypothetical protein
LVEAHSLIPLPFNAVKQFRGSTAVVLLRILRLVEFFLLSDVIFWRVFIISKQLYQIALLPIMDGLFSIDVVVCQIGFICLVILGSRVDVCCIVGKA